MTVVIQQLGTDLFLGEAGGWVKEQAAACVFASTGEAISHCVTKGLVDVRIGMIFGDPKLDIYLYPFRLQDERARTRELREANRALRQQQEELMGAMNRAAAELAAAQASLPLVRKKKRKKPDRG